MRLPVASALVLLLAGCVRANASHCGNLSGDMTCAARGQNAPYCSVCVAANDGCVGTVPAPDCRPEGRAGTTGATGQETTDPSASGPDVGDSAETGATTGPPATVCGDGIKEGDENCDGSDLGGTECADLFGFESGTLTCTDCVFNTDGCQGESSCGNGIPEMNLGEQCDGDPGVSCASVKGMGYDGQITCTECQLDESACCLVPMRRCNTDEECCSRNCKALLDLPDVLPTCQPAE